MSAPVLTGLEASYLLATIGGVLLIGGTMAAAYREEDGKDVGRSPWVAGLSGIALALPMLLRLLTLALLD